MRPSKREPSISSKENKKTLKRNLLRPQMFDLLIATSASRSLENRTTPVSKPRISANFTSPTSRNLSRRFCHVQVEGSWNESLVHHQTSSTTLAYISDDDSIRGLLTTWIPSSVSEIAWIVIVIRRCVVVTDLISVRRVVSSTSRESTAGVVSIERLLTLRRTDIIAPTAVKIYAQRIQTCGSGWQERIVQPQTSQTTHNIRESSQIARQSWQTVRNIWNRTKQRVWRSCNRSWDTCLVL